MIKRILKLFSPEKDRPEQQSTTSRGNSHGSGKMSASDGPGDRLPIPEEWQPLLAEMEQGRGHIFVTGQAGSGKSTFIRQFLRMTGKNVVVTAPTGLAAINAGGVTIHSFAQFPPSVITADSIRESNEKQLLAAIDTIIVDEISMVRCDLLDGLDRFMRKNGRNADLPFGGVQVILVGDPYQLQPAVREDEIPALKRAGYPGPYYFWNSKVYPEITPRKLDLTEVGGHAAERGFVGVLDSIRVNDVDNGKLDLLQECIVEPDFDPFSRPFHTALTPRHSEASYYNNKQFYRLPKPQMEYRAKRSGSALNVNNPEDNFPCEENLLLRPGTRVIFCKTVDPKIVNGTLGTVIELEEDAVLMKTDDGRSIRVVASFWELIRYCYNGETGRVEPRVTGTIEQIPLRHAWAVSIHRAQGILFDNAHIDLTDEAFLPGQAYIALSRCRTLAGTKLKSEFAPKDIMVDQHVVDFMGR